MQVRMKISIAYYDNGLRTAGEGEVIDLPEADAMRMIERGDAETVESKPEEQTVKRTKRGA